jgi:hypothetical protein
MIKAKIGIIAEELFQFSLITYLILLLAETVKEGFVTFFFDLNYLLVVVLVSGILMALLAPEMSDRTLRKPEKLNATWVIIFSIGGGLLVYYKTQELGNISLLISGITTIIIFLLSILIYTDDENTAHKE